MNTTNNSGQEAERGTFMQMQVTLLFILGCLISFILGVLYTTLRFKALLYRYELTCRASLAQLEYLVKERNK